MDISVAASQGENLPLPSKLFTGAELAEVSLQMVGAFTTMDASADPRDVARSLTFMELAVAQLNGTTSMQWLVPQTIQFTLEPEVQSYSLSDVLGTSFPSLGISHAIDAYLLDSNGNETPISIKRRRDYDNEPSKTTSGDPQYIVIDRQLDDDTRVYTYPVKADNDLTAYIKLRVQTYSPSVIGALANSGVGGEVAHGFDRAWQLWLCTATACLIGNGPVRQLTKAKLDGLKEDRDRAFLMLQAFQNREKISTRLRRTRRYGD